MDHWYKAWFESDEYLEVYKHRDTKDAQKIIDLILIKLKCTNSCNILDMACGSGRHASIFASKGFLIVGFDLSFNLLKEAKKKSAMLQKPFLLLRADIRNIPLNNKFHLVLNLFTSFGYFESDDENFSVFKSAFNLLEENGWFIFDYLNTGFLRLNLVPETKEQISDDFSVEQYRTIVNDFVKKDIYLIKGKNRKHYTEKVKLYDHNTIISKIKDSGFSDYLMFGDYDGNNFNKSKSQRLIIMAKK